MSAVRQGAGLYPRCCADQKEEKGMEADPNTAKLTRLEKKSKSSVQGKRSTTPEAQSRKSNKQIRKAAGVPSRSEREEIQQIWDSPLK